MVREVNAANGSGSNPPRGLRGLVLGLSAHAAIAFGQEVPPPAYQLAAQQAGVAVTPVLWRCAATRRRTPALILRRGRSTSPARAGSGHTAGPARRHPPDAGTHPANRIDAGLGQVNLGYHAHRYAHPCDLLDLPQIAGNPEKYTPGEDWLVAIGRYHRPQAVRRPPASAASPPAPDPRARAGRFTSLCPSSMP